MLNTHLRIQNLKWQRPSPSPPPDGSDLGENESVCPAQLGREQKLHPSFQLFPVAAREVTEPLLRVGDGEIACQPSSCPVWGIA